MACLSWRGGIHLRAGLLRSTLRIYHRETETQLCSASEHNCKMLGAEGVSYPPIVASGTDACTIHYSRNDKVNCELLTCSGPSRSDHVSMTVI